MNGAYCPECRKPMHMGSDGFYFHDGLPCSIRATLDPVDAEGNYPDDDYGPSDHDERMAERRQMGLDN